MAALSLDDLLGAPTTDTATGGSSTRKGGEEGKGVAKTQPPARKKSLLDGDY
jgi:hypothetical protein